jgi:SulP family sulfate permease
VALVGFAEPTAIARTFAAADRDRWDANRELVSQGVANLAAGLSGGFPVGGSFARTSVNRLAGARTRWSGAVTGIVVLAFLPVASLLEPLPRAVLAAIVIAAVWKLIRLGELVRIWKKSRPQAAVGALTFVATIALSPRIDLGVLIGIGAAILVHLWRELRIRVTVEQEEADLVVRLYGVLFFASAPDLEDRLLEGIAGHEDIRRVILDLSRLGRIDYTGAVALKDLVEDVRNGGLRVELAGAPPQAKAMLSRVWGETLPG